jgi:hypothetical protein
MIGRGQRAVTDPADMERVLRHLEDFRALHETEGVTSLTGPGGILWCIADLERITVVAVMLPQCQATAVSALVADGNPSRCLLPAVTALCEIYDSASLWGNDVASRLRRVFCPCPGNSLAAA